MAEITPNTTITLFSGVPLSPDYKNTIWFDNHSQQREYFKANATNPYFKYDFDKQYYTRVNGNQIKVKVQADRIRDVNYMCFHNAAYPYNVGGGKWFYAFVTSVSWINNEVSLLTFEIDVMQTYLFDAVLKECFVEREHSSVDYVGANVVEESLYTGPDFVQSKEANGSPVFPTERGFPLCGYVILTTETGTGESPSITLQNSLPTSLDVHSGYSTTGQYTDAILSAIHVITEYKGGETVVSAYAVPAELIRKNNGKIASYDETISVLCYPVALDGYIPKNMKMYTHQYCRLYCSNNSGNTVEYHSELFNNIDSTGHVRFRLMGAAVPTPEIVCAPMSYRNVGTDFDNAISINDFPPIPFTGDVYKAYVAKNSESNILKALSTIVTSSISGAAAAGIPGAAVGALAGVGLSTANMIGNYVQANAAPNAAKNVHGLSAFKAAFSRYRFSFYHTTVQHDYAQIIDNYFTMYGYATKKIKVPNRNVRRRFTYTKTTDCTIIGKMPADDIVKMQNIYNKGITFWNRNTVVGKYPESGNTTYDNPPI